VKLDSVEKTDGETRFCRENVRGTRSCHTISMNYGENQYDLREVGVKLKNTLTKELRTRKLKRS